jgi:MYXO-CTERM domain-containing protein
MRYRNDMIDIGLPISGATATLLMLAAIFGRRRRAAVS